LQQSENTNDENKIKYNTLNWNLVFSGIKWFGENYGRIRELIILIIDDRLL